MPRAAHHTEAITAAQQPANALPRLYSRGVARFSPHEPATMDGGYGGENLVDEDEVITAIKMCIEGAFGKSAEQPYSPALVQKASDSLINTCLKNLAQQNKPYKWAVTCVVQQKTGAGLVTSCCMHWDAKKDTRCSIAWENDKLNVIVTVYAMAIDAGDAGPGGNDDGY